MRGIKRERVGIEISLNLRFLRTLKTSLMGLKKHKETEIYKELECLLDRYTGLPANLINHSRSKCLGRGII